MAMLPSAREASVARKRSSWLLICKPLVAPFHDGTSVVAASLIAGLSPSRTLTYLGNPDQPLAKRNDHVVRAPAMSHQPTFGQRLRLLALLCSFRHRKKPVHLLFTPSRLTARLVGLIARLMPKRRYLVTLMAGHACARIADYLDVFDRIVVHSQHAREQLEQAGVLSSRICVIYPGVVGKADATRGEDATSNELLFAGDLTQLASSRLLALAQLMQEDPGLSQFRLIVAARPKAQADALRRNELLQAMQPLIDQGRAELLGRIADLPHRISRAALQLFFDESVPRKVDLPLVLLESLALATPLIIAAADPVREIFQLASRHGLEVGAEIARTDDPAIFAQEVATVLHRRLPDLERWRKDARTLYEREFTANAMANAYETLYCQLEEPDFTR